MYEIIKNVIENKDYELKDILYKINKMWIESGITEEQKEELDNLARENAKAENSYAPFQEQINEIFKRIEKLETYHKAEDSEEPVEEYPEFAQPTGSHNAYNTGDKITFKDKKYICKIDGCVWSPDIYPEGWKEVEETEEG